ncbi:hypothetical protein [Gemmata sp.]|uniref:hypothetical protein n=1 Tax=Gemmata sp. TaxID=1914242 RepID=UPI003F6EA6DA
MEQEFVFEGGQFRPCEVLPEPGELRDERLGAAGYRRGQEFGDTDGTHFVLWERAGEARAGACWVVAFCTPDRSCLVACRTWPDLIGLLALLGPIAAASVLDGGTRAVLEDALLCRARAGRGPGTSAGADDWDAEGPAVRVGRND